MGFFYTVTSPNPTTVYWIVDNATLKGTMKPPPRGPHSIFLTRAHTPRITGSDIRAPKIVSRQTPTNLHEGVLLLTEFTLSSAISHGRVKTTPKYERHRLEDIGRKGAAVCAALGINVTDAPQTKEALSLVGQESPFATAEEAFIFLLESTFATLTEFELLGKALTSKRVSRTEVASYQDVVVKCLTFLSENNELREFVLQKTVNGKVRLAVKGIKAA